MPSPVQAFHISILEKKTSITEVECVAILRQVNGGSTVLMSGETCGSVKATLQSLIRKMVDDVNDRSGSDDSDLPPQGAHPRA